MRDRSSSLGQVQLALGKRLKEKIIKINLIKFPLFIDMSHKISPLNLLWTTVGCTGIG